MADEGESKGALVNIDLGTVGEAAKELINAVAKGCGLLYEPHHVVKMAKAEAEAEKIRAMTTLEVQEREWRAFQRLRHEEIRKQENIESITQKALEYLPKDAEPKKINEDWMARFLDKGKQTSDEEMQNLWAKILAGEATAAGKFSKRTLEVVHTLDKDEATLFTKICHFCWRQVIGAQVVNGALQYKFTPLLLIFNLEDEIYKQQGITFVGLQHLDTIGLIKFENVTDFQVIASGNLPIQYPGQPLSMIAAVKEKPILLGKARLTETGEQLFSVCGTGPLEGVFEYTKQYWKMRGIEMTDAPPFLGTVQAS